MRVLLAALNAGKGDLAGNLRRHIELLERARADGCDLAVFPEFSLTGSVDPTHYPEHAVAVDAAPVQELVATSHHIGVAALFGIAERAGDGYYISQLYAHGGRLAGPTASATWATMRPATAPVPATGCSSSARPGSAWRSAQRAG